MPTRDTAPVGAPCWVDLMTSDTEGSRAFYGEVFGWTAEDPVEQFGGYFSFRKDGALVAGCMAAEPGTDVSDVWSVYLATDDAKKTVDAATAEGGRVILAAMDVGDLGAMAVVTDPGGASIGIWQPGLHPGFQVLGETGTPSWFELHTRNYQASIDFYRSVFRWDTHVTSDTPEFRYTVQSDGEAWLAGVMDASDFQPEGVPAQWSVYFGVDDTDAALAKIVDLGGSIVLPAEDTPYGRLATAADPAGARFKLVQHVGRHAGEGAGRQWDGGGSPSSRAEAAPRAGLPVAVDRGVGLLGWRRCDAHGAPVAGGAALRQSHRRVLGHLGGVPALAGRPGQRGIGRPVGSPQGHGGG